MGKYINNDRILVLIPARGGSKGIPFKNLALVGDKPLIAHTIETVNNCNLSMSVIVSTDSEDIAKIALKFGAEVPFLRPTHLALDHSPTIESVVYTIEKLKNMGRTFDTLILLQPTSPLRSEIDILSALNLFYQSNRQGVVSVSLTDVKPILLRTIKSNYLLPLISTSSKSNSSIRRQDMEEIYIVNGAIYINSISEVDSTLSFNDNPIPYIMPRERSIDIDTLEDLEKARALFKVAN